MAVKTVIASGKGGVGKSTVCKSLGLSLSEMGKKTLLIDCDAGLSSLDIMLSCRENVSFTWADIVNGSCSTEDAIMEINENLSLIPSPVSPLYEDFESAVSDITAELNQNYDFILIDAPAGIGRGLRRAAKGASKALIVATGDEISVKGAETVSSVLREIGITESRLLINRYDVKAAKKGRFLTVDEIIDKTLVQLIGIIPENKNIMYGTVSEKKLNTRNTDKAFMRVACRISGANVPLQLSQLKK